MQNLFRQLAVNISFLLTKKWLIMLCMAGFIEAAGMGIISPIIPLYAQSFGLSTTLIGIFMSFFAVGRVLVNIPAGRIADRFGRRKLIVLGPFILSFAALCLATATNYTQLLLSRFLHGMGSALFLTGAFLVLADLSLPEDRGRVNSFFQASMILGLTISPFVGGVIATNMGFHAVFYFHSVIVFLIGIFIWWYFPESLGSHLSNPSAAKNNATSRSESPVDDLLKTRSLLLVAAVGFIIFVSRSGSRDTLLPLLGAGVFGLDPTSVGMIFTISAATNLLAIPIAGILSDSRGRKPVILLGLFLNGLGLLLAGWATNLIPFILGAVLMAFGKGFGETSTVVYIADMSNADRYGRSYGPFLSLRDLGLLIGPLTLGWLADRTNLHFPLILNGFVMLMMMVLFWFVARESLQKTETRLSTF
jgi:DHA1 family multidrug resistance protein-like MFS transporter